MPITLIVDDDPEFASLCQETLGPTGEHEFIIATDDASAIEILKKIDTLDVAIVAIDKDNVSGLELFKKLTGRRVRVPRIALTGSADLPLIRRAMNDGAADFLTRPVAAKDLERTICKVYEDTERRRKAWRTEAQLSAIRREVDIAGDIQKRILPTVFPERPGLEVAAILESAKDMSGDFYDVFEIGDGRIGYVVADVVGKGIPAAFFMAVARTLLQATATAGTPPAECLSQVNDLICRHEITSMFVSVFYGVLNPRTWELTYANGGHLPPVRIGGKTGVTTLISGGDGVVLGVEAGLTYEQETLQIDPGDTLFLYTDGLTEAFNETRDQFGEQRLQDFLSINQGNSPEALCRTMLDHIKEFTGGAEAADDMTCLAIYREVS